MGQRDLPLASGEKHVKAFERAGWICRPKLGKGHFILTKPGERHALSIPNHKEVKRALLQKQIQQARLTEEQYLKCFQNDTR